MRTPIRTVSLLNSVVLEEYGHALPEEAREMLTRVETACLSLDALLDGLQELAGLRDAPCRRVPCDVVAMADEIFATLRQAHPGRDVRVCLPDAWTTEADPALLRLLLRNLLDNAWKYTAERAVAEIRLTVAGEAGRDTFAVEDDGVGFDNAHAERIFRPLERLHDRSRFPGSGLGLATAARVVARHGGTITADATPGGGARFRFTLGPAPGS